MDAGSPLIAGIFAIRTTGTGSEDGRVGGQAQLLSGVLVELTWLSAGRAEAAHQSLRHDAHHRRGYEEGFDPHIDKPGHGAKRIIGMQGGKDEVAGKRGLNRDFGSFTVPDFAHHHDIRVLSENRAQPAGEGQVDLRIDLNLSDTMQLILNRVFDGDDIARRSVEPREGRVECRRLAAAGGAGNQQDPVTGLDQTFELLEEFAAEPKFLKGEKPTGAVEEAQHNTLAELGRNGRDADVDIASGGTEPKPSVLGQALLRDIESGKNLDARGGRRMIPTRRLEDIV